MDEDIGLLDGTRFELVRHTEGEPMQLGFAGELTEQQRELLLSGVPVRSVCGGVGVGGHGARASVGKKGGRVQQRAASVGRAGEGHKGGCEALAGVAT